MTITCRAIFNHVARRAIYPTDSWDWCLYLLPPLSKFDIHDTLQNEFCAIWNEIVQKARDRFWLLRPGPSVYLLRRIRHLYVALHQGTDAAPTPFDASTTDKDLILERPSSYPFCDIAADHSTPNGSTAPPAQGPPSPSFESNHVHIPPQATVPSIHELMQTFAPDLNRLVSVSNFSMLVSLFSPQSSSSTVNLIAKIRRNNELTPDVPINEIGETSQTRRTTLLTSTLFPSPLLLPLQLIRLLFLWNNRVNSPTLRNPMP